MKKIRRFKGKEDIFENSEFTCYCKIVSSGKFLQVRLIIIIFNDKVFTSGILSHKSTKSCV